MSQLNAEFVKRGFWVNNPDGPIMGQTITTDTRTGTVIVAFIAILTTFGIGHFWNLVVFAYHQMRVHNKPTDGLYRQQQALMRTLSPPNTMLSDWLKLWWHWRNRNDRTLVRSLPFLVLAFVFFGATVVVGVFSSYFVNSDDITVLVSSPYCGPIDYQGVNVPDDSVESWRAWYVAYAGRISELGDRYVRDCYKNQSATTTTTTTTERCRNFVRPTIPSGRERTSCPFEQSICKNISQPGLAMDTGLLDLNDYLGLNLAAKHKMKFRHKATCAILELEGHYDVIVSSNSTGTELAWVLGRKLYSEEQLRRFYLGETGAGNYTMSISYMPIDLSRRMEAAPQWHYSSPFWKNSSSFFPISQLKSNESDLFLTFVLMHSVGYLEPVEDPLFSAHRMIRIVETNNSTRTIYQADEPVSVYGCQYQYQFCFAQDDQKDVCLTLQGLPSTQPLSDLPSVSETQLALFKLLVNLLAYHHAGTALAFFQPVGLNPQYNAPLPSDQWVHQLVLLNNVAITQIQIALSTYAVGPSTLDLGVPTPMRNGQSEAEKALCGLQRMRSPGGYVNIHVFTLTFIITLCVVTMVLDILLLKFLIFWDKPRKLLAPRIHSWINDGVFQFQRRAYEAHGEGTWERLGEEIPVTTRGIELTNLPPNSTPLCKCNTMSSTTGRSLSSNTATGPQNQSQVSNLQTQPATAQAQAQPVTRTAQKVGRTISRTTSATTNPQSGLNSTTIGSVSRASTSPSPTIATTSQAVSRAPATPSALALATTNSQAGSNSTNIRSMPPIPLSAPPAKTTQLEPKSTLAAGFRPSNPQ